MLSGTAEQDAEDQTAVLPELQVPQEQLKLTFTNTTLRPQVGDQVYIEANTGKLPSEINYMQEVGSLEELKGY